MRKRKEPQPMTQQEAVNYLTKVLSWENFIKGHQKIKLAIECILGVENQNNEEKYGK